jgi:hypothetical protein
MTKQWLLPHFYHIFAFFEQTHPVTLLTLVDFSLYTHIYKVRFFVLENWTLFGGIARAAQQTYMTYQKV